MLDAAVGNVSCSQKAQLESLRGSAAFLARVAVLAHSLVQRVLLQATREA